MYSGANALQCPHPAQNVMSELKGEKHTRSEELDCPRLFGKKYRLTEILLSKEGNRPVRSVKGADRKCKQAQHKCTDH